MKMMGVLRRGTGSIVYGLEKLPICFVIWLIGLIMFSLSRHSTFPTDESYSCCLPDCCHQEWEMMMLLLHYYKPDMDNINPKKRKVDFAFL